MVAEVQDLLRALLASLPQHTASLQFLCGSGLKQSSGCGS